MSKSEFQQYIDKGAPPLDPDEEFKVKDGAHFEQFVLFYWGRDCKLTGGQKHSFIQLANRFTWEEIYDMVKTASELGGTKKCFRYVEKSLEGKAKQAVEKATAQKKKLEHCPKCYEGYWSDMRHECTIEVFDEPATPEANTEEKPEDVRRKIEEIREQWKHEEGKTE